MADQRPQRQRNAPPRSYEYVDTLAAIGSPSAPRRELYDLVRQVFGWESGLVSEEVRLALESETPENSNIWSRVKAKITRATSRMIDAIVPNGIRAILSLMGRTTRSRPTSLPRTSSYRPIL